MDLNHDIACLGEVTKPYWNAQLLSRLNSPKTPQDIYWHVVPRTADELDEKYVHINLPPHSIQEPLSGSDIERQPAENIANLLTIVDWSIWDEVK